MAAHWALMCRQLLRDASLPITIRRVPFQVVIYPGMALSLPTAICP
jgi:hypothetical protein